MLEATCFRINDAVTDRYFRHEEAVAWTIEEGSVSERLGLSIRHHTGFTYDGVAKSSYNEARMTPARSLLTQQVQSLQDLGTSRVCRVDPH